MLQPHGWDDALHRAAIHAAFDIWFVAYEKHAWPRARKWRQELARLCADAQYREKAAEFHRAMAALGPEDIGCG